MFDAFAKQVSNKPLPWFFKCAQPGAPPMEPMRHQFGAED